MVVPKGRASKRRGVSPAFSFCEVNAMSELSIFVDESGDQNGQSEYYIVVLVFHEQADDIRNSIEPYVQALEMKGLPNIPLHASPLMNGHDAYANLELATRKRLLAAFLTFFRHLPIRYKPFVYKRSEFGGNEELSSRIRRDIVEALFDNLQFFQSFDIVKIYYDDAQKIVTDALRKAFDYALSKNAVLHRKAAPEDYRLAQVADFLCTMELVACKYAHGKQTATDRQFFGSANSFKKDYMKAIERKRL